MTGPRDGFSTFPLAPSFERMAEMRDELYLFARLGTPDGDGWVSMSRLAEDGEVVREQLRIMKEKWDLDNRSTAIGVVGGLAWQVVGAALFVYATERRVPDLSPDNVMLRIADGGLAGSRLRERTLRRFGGRFGGGICDCGIRGRGWVAEPFERRDRRDDLSRRGQCPGGYASLEADDVEPGLGSHRTKNAPLRRVRRG
ncbi:MAG: hypothetical protein M3494_11105 [Actinomycetota bacterium]|jgi:hypothetical protein|nr:hypothetical protein [Actinomycetota bacterium]